jgi:hypothetical protein
MNAMKRRRRISARRATGLAVGLAALAVAGESPDIFYPAGAYFNAVTDGGIDNTGRTDVTAPLQALILQQRGQGGGPAFRRHIFLPKGTYLVSGSLRMKIDRSRSQTSHSHGPWIVGESRTETIVRLKDGTWPQPRYALPLDGEGDWERRIDEQVVLNTGDCTNTTFNKVIRNLTVNTGRNNAGAIGVQYNTSNQGYLGEVDIVSEDGRGVAGLALAGVENGPGQVRNVTIRGFDAGIYSVTAYVFAYSGIFIDGARRVGVLNRGDIAGDGWRIRMADTAGIPVRNHRAMALIGLDIAGPGAAHPAIANDGMLYVRDVRSRGYAGAIAGQGDEVAEYYSGEAAGRFHNTGTALALPVEPQPLVPWERDLARWADPADFGAVAGPNGDASEAVERALNAPGVTHVVVREHYRVRRPIRLGPGIVRIAGPGILNMRRTEQPDAALVIGDGDAPAVSFDDIRIDGIDIETDRTVVMNGVRDFQWGPVTTWFFNGGGRVFVNNSHAGIQVNHPDARVWIRHYNAESNQDSTIPWANIQVKAGRVWVLGWKSESLKRRVIVEQAGAAEVYGFNNYDVSGKDKDGDWPIFEVKDGQFGFAVLNQRGNRVNRNIVWEWRGGERRVFDIEANGGRNRVLYAGYDPAGIGEFRR